MRIVARTTYRYCVVLAARFGAPLTHAYLEDCKLLISGVEQMKRWYDERTRADVEIFDVYIAKVRAFAAGSGQVTLLTLRQDFERLHALCRS